MAKYDVSSGLSEEERERREHRPYGCPRKNCEERFKDHLALEFHLARDHDLPWDAPPEERRE